MMKNLMNNKKFLISVIVVSVLLIVATGVIGYAKVTNNSSTPSIKNSTISETKKGEIKGDFIRDPNAPKDFYPEARVVKGFNKSDNPMGPILNVVVKNLTNKPITISGSENQYFSHFIVVISKNEAGQELARESLSFTLQPNEVSLMSVLLFPSDETKHFTIVYGINSPPKIVGTYIPSKEAEGKIAVYCNGITGANGYVTISVKSIYNGYFPGNWYARATYKDASGNVVGNSNDRPLPKLGPDGRSYQVIIGGYGQDLPRGTANYMPKSTTNYEVTVVKK